MKPSHRCLAAAVALMIAAGAAFAADVNGITAVASRAADDYVRAKGPNGALVPESYVFGEGGTMGSQLSDPSFFKMSFLDVAHVIAGPLADRQYVPAKDPSKTKLLIMVYWGTTDVVPLPKDDPDYDEARTLLDEAKLLGKYGDDLYFSALTLINISNHQRDLKDYNNAKLLGYSGENYGSVATDYGRFIGPTALGLSHRDETAELEENRYYVILMAYDFQVLWKQKKHKLLWETRFSLDERNNAFDKALPVMADSASKYFGVASNGLIRDNLGAGRVDVGDPTLIEFLSGSKK